MNFALRIANLLLPSLGLLALAALAQPYVAGLSGARNTLVAVIPLVVYIAGLVLSLRFNRSRVFFVLLIIGVAYLVLIRIIPPGSTTTPGFAAQTAYAALAVLLPLNLAGFSMLRERGMFTLWGGIRFLILLAQVSAVAWVILAQRVELAAWLEYPAFAPAMFAWTPLPQPALLALFLAILVLNGRIFAQPAAQNSAFLGVLLAAAVALHVPGNVSVTITFLGAAGLILVIAIIQESWSMAYIDELTALPGRRALQEQLQKLGGHYAIAMLDVDRFKKFNDTYGHDVGDDVLRMVAARIRAVGGGGKAFRYGGEEFCIVFSGREVREASGYLDVLRESIAVTTFEIHREDRRQHTPRKRRDKRSRNNVRITISIGVAEKDERRQGSWDVLKAADRALYRAKKKGRNRICR